MSMMEKIKFLSDIEAPNVRASGEIILEEEHIKGYYQNTSSAECIKIQYIGTSGADEGEICETAICDGSIHVATYENCDGSTHGDISSESFISSEEINTTGNITVGKNVFANSIIVREHLAIYTSASITDEYGNPIELGGNGGTTIEIPDGTNEGAIPMWDGTKFVATNVPVDPLF